MINNRGSVWRKWDLHLHTPSSYDYEDKSVTNENIVTSLKEKGVEVAVVTDHHIIDTERIEALQALGNGEIIFLPGIEFLSDTRGREPIHFIGIFSEDSKITHIWEQIKNKTNITKIYTEDKKENEVYCNLESTVDLIHELGGLVSIHAGSKTNSIENIPHSLPHSTAQKEDIAKLIDIFELGKLEDAEGYTNIVNPHLETTIGKKIPLVMGSDNHNIIDYDITRTTWIKADKTFNGLKQILFEPVERVSLSESSPYDNKQIFLVESIDINNSENFEIEDQKIEFNRDLVSVIGGRGSGKSLLLSIIKHINGKGYDYSGEISKTAGINYKIINKSAEAESYDIQIDQDVHNGIPLLYIGQSELEEKAKDKDAVRQALLREIKIPDINSNYNSIISLTDRLVDKANSYKLELEAIEDDYTETTKTEFTNFVKKIEDDIKSLNERKDKLSTAKSKKLINQLSTVITKGAKYSQWLKSDHINQLEESVKATNEIIQTINNLTNELALKDQKEIAKIDKSSFMDDYNSNVDIVKEERSKLVIQYQALKQELIDSGIKEDPTALTKAVENIQTEIDSLIKIKDKYQQIKTNLDETLSDLNLIFNTKQDDSVFKMITTAKEEISDAFTKFIENNPSDYFKAVFTEIDVKPFVKFDFKKLIDDLNECFLKGHRPKNFKSEIFGDDYPTFESYLSWISQNKAASYFNDYRIDQFKQGGRETFLEIVFKNWFDYIKVLPNIIGGNKKPLDQMSLGEKATVMLKLKLATEGQVNQIIVIDQPEDHLDNRFITTELTGLLRTVKKFKQIIIATHNANVVIGADSEQIIVASLDDSKDKKYKSGAIENEEIQNDIVLLLEGGRTALDKRYSRYS